MRSLVLGPPPSSLDLPRTWVTGRRLFEGLVFPPREETDDRTDGLRFTTTLFSVSGGIARVSGDV